jgi:hypothetical protein
MSILVWLKALDLLIRVGGSNVAVLDGPSKYVLHSRGGGFGTS